jgi:hypothetical protein
VNPRKLALDLLQLDRRDRERLLAELPTPRRAEMIALMRQAESLADRSDARFEAHLDEAIRAEPHCADFSPSNEGQLRVLLSTEQLFVQQRVIEALRSGELASWPGSVRRVVLEWLRSRQHVSSVAMEDTRSTVLPWRRFWIRRKSA